MEEGDVVNPPAIAAKREENRLTARSRKPARSVAVQPDQEPLLHQAQAGNADVRPTGTILVGSNSFSDSQCWRMITPLPCMTPTSGSFFRVTGRRVSPTCKPARSAPQPRRRRQLYKTGSYRGRSSSLQSSTGISGRLAACSRFKRAVLVLRIPRRPVIDAKLRPNAAPINTWGFPVAASSRIRLSSSRVRRLTVITPARAASIGRIGR